MKTDRRTFIKSMGLGIGGWGLMSMAAKESHPELVRHIAEIEDLPAEEVARDESFWAHVQEAFDVDRSLINLNNGGAHPAPRVAMQALHRNLDFANGAPVVNSWQIIRPRRERIRQALADTFGCSSEEIAITRNVTEALQIALLGIELKPGDEILTTTHDYPSMKNALFHREKKEGIKVKFLPIPCPAGDLGELTAIFEKNIGPRTRMILICHITNTNGQIFPVRDICRLARSRGIEVVVDGAHAIGHFVFKRDDLGCDIYGANLHKWIMSPIGSGFLYVRKEKIKKIWPLFPAPDPWADDIRKFENYGTHPEPIWLAVGEALAFHHGLGPKRKEERLRYLKNYWTNSLKKLPGFRIATPDDPRMSCGIGSFRVEGMDMSRFVQVLADNHRIHTTGLSLDDNLQLVRVTPSIYTTLQELDVFIETTSRYIKNGLPK